MDISSFTVRVTNCKNAFEVMTVKIELVNYLHDLGIRYSDQLRQFSESVISNKEEWYKKSMAECVHQAGREVGYEHEATKVEIEATKILLQIIGDTERVVLGELEHQTSGPEQTTPVATSESSALPVEESE